MKTSIQHFKRHLALMGLCLSLTTFSGCGEQTSPEVTSLRTLLLLKEEPSGAVSIEEARQLVSEKPEDLVLILRVGNRNLSTWSSEDQATFFASEGYPGSDYNIGPDHDPSTCPFCKWKWKDEDSMAIMEVVNEQGEAVPYSAVQIFNFKPEDFIVVKGTGQLDEEGMLKVQISGLYKRPPS